MLLPSITDIVLVLRNIPFPFLPLLLLPLLFILLILFLFLHFPNHPVSSPLKSTEYGVLHSMHCRKLKLDKSEIDVFGLHKDGNLYANNAMYSANHYCIELTKMAKIEVNNRWNSWVWSNIYQSTQNIYSSFSFSYSSFFRFVFTLYITSIGFSWVHLYVISMSIHSINSKCIPLVWWYHAFFWR